MSWVRDRISKTRELAKKLPMNGSELVASTEVVNRKHVLDIKGDKSITNTIVSIKPVGKIIYTDTESCLKYIDAICYINLEHRLDRKEHCLKEISKIDPTFSKTHRIDAIYNKENGALGCTASHIKTLKMFLENDSWKTMLILEDDYTFISNDPNEINGPINHLFNSARMYDIFLLCQSAESFQALPSSFNYINRVLSSQTTSAYIVNKAYAKLLLYTFTVAYDNMSRHGFKVEWCVDQCWKLLMLNDNWYTLCHRIGYQYDNYSDIEKKEVAYGC
jgi:glycosyl transferase, family 25